MRQQTVKVKVKKQYPRAFIKSLTVRKLGAWKLKVETDYFLSPSAAVTKTKPDRFIFFFFLRVATANDTGKCVLSSFMLSVLKA